MKREESEEEVGLARGSLPFPCQASNRLYESRWMTISGEREVLMYRRKALETIPVITRCNAKKN